MKVDLTRLLQFDQRLRRASLAIYVVAGLWVPLVALLVALSIRWMGR